MYERLEEFLLARLARHRTLASPGAVSAQEQAAVEEIRAVVPDCAPGAIPPFGALYGLRSFVDRSLLASRDVTMPAGDFGTVTRMSSTEFLRLAGARVGDFAVPETLAPRAGRRAGAARRRAS